MSEDTGESLGTCEIVAKTARAILVESEDYGEVWCPLSQVHDDSELYEDSSPGDSGELVVRTWFAEQKGWV